MNTENHGQNRPLRRLAGRVFADLGRARVTPRQALIYERLIRVTLACGRQSVRIPRLEMFARFKLSRGNVSEALNGFWSPSEAAVDRRWVPGLVELGMLQVVASADGGSVFTVLPDATQWRCEWRFERAADDSFRTELDAVADQVQPELIEREPGLPEALAAVSLENALVPESGTGGDSLKSSEFRSSELGTKLLTPELSKGKEGELMDRCRELFGEKVMVNWGGCWRNRARQNYGKLDRVLLETESEMKRRTINNPSGYANDLWKRFR